MRKGMVLINTTREGILSANLIFEHRFGTDTTKTVSKAVKVGTLCS